MTPVSTSITHLEQGREPGVTSTPFTKDHLPHPPIPLIEMVSTNNHEVPWADMEKWSLRLNREIAVISRHKSPTIQYACTNSHGGVGLATGGQVWRLGAGVLRDTDVSTFAPNTWADGCLSSMRNQVHRLPFVAQGFEPAAVEKANQ